MENDIDILAVELAKSSMEDLKKGLPPKLRYKFMKWLKSMKPNSPDKQMDRRQVVETAKKEITDRILEAMARKSLAKNEVMASAYNDGAIKFDFGSGVPEKIKKAALTWAKKRGLNAVEASLAKSETNSTSVLFIGKETNPIRSCMKRHKWTIS